METKQPLSAGLFYMWRSLVAIAWADGSCGKQETDYFAKVFATLPRYYLLTQEQRNTLADDLENHPKQVEELYSYINDPEIRGMLVCFAHDLVKLDGVVDPDEEAILKRLDLWNAPSYDKEKLMAEVRQAIADYNAKEKAEIHREIQRISPVMGALDRLLLRLGIDTVE